MKPTKAAIKSSKIIIKKIQGTANLYPNKVLDTTVIPIGSTDAFVELPSLKDTYTYNIINTNEMTGNITLKTSSGSSLKGLMLRSNGGLLSIEPIQVGTDELTLESDVKDGCYIQTLSNGNEWFVWSVATGGTINVGNRGIVTTHPPTIPGPSYADVTNVVITSDVRFVGGGLEARHDLVLSGEGEPGASLTISETTGNADAALVFPITIQIASDGTWLLDKNTLATNLPNGRYEFDFTPTLGNGVGGVVFNENTGAINFTVPSTFTPDPAEVVDFQSGASAVKPDGTSINVVVDSSGWTPNLAHGDTFVIIYSITDPAINGGVTVSQTVTGTIVDDTPPAAPVFTTAAITNNNELNASGTAEPGKTITLFRNNQPLSPTVVSDPITGNWSIGPIVLTFNGIFTLKAQASEAGSLGSDGLNRSDFAEYSPDFDFQQLVTPPPTIGVNGEQTSVWTNTANSFTISGTTEIGATIEVLDGANPATLVSGPTVDGAGDWSATIDVANESVTSLSAKATIANHHQSTAASFQLNVDRVPPTITLTGSDQTVRLPNVGSNNDLGYNVSDLSSGVATQTSDWDNQVSTTTEGDYTVTYNAIDNAGNSASPVTRNVTVTTEVIVPIITNVTDNLDGTLTIQGQVNGDFSDNLEIQGKVGGNNDGSPVEVQNGLFEYTTTNLGNGTFAITAVTVNHVDEESNPSNQEDRTILIQAPPDTEAPVITVVNNLTGLPIIDGGQVTIEVGQNFTFTATALDNPGNVDLTNSITEVTNNVNNNQAGNYVVGLSVTDGVNTTTLNFNVEVQAIHHLEEETDDSQEPNSLFRLLGNATVRSDGILEVDGSNSSYAEHYYQTSDIADYVIPTDESKTVSVWFYARSLNSGNALIDGSIIASSNKEPNGNNPQNGGFAISVSGGKIRGKAPRNLGRGDLSYNTTIDTNEWYKIDLVWRADGTAGAGEYYNELYLNGSLVANKADQQEIVAGSDLKVGWGYWNLDSGTNGIGNPFDGFIDRLIVRERALSASDISANYTSELAIVSALDVTPPVMTITHTDTNTVLSDGDTVSLTDGELFNFTASTTPESFPVVVEEGGSTVTTGASFGVGTYAITFNSTDGVNEANTITINLEITAVANFIEDIPTVISRNSNINPATGIADDNSSTKTHGVTVRLGTDGIIEYNNNQPVNDEFTISWWMLPDGSSSQAANVLGVIGHAWGPSTSKYALNMSNIGNNFSQPFYVIQVNADAVNYSRTDNGFIGDGNWHHFAIRCQSDGSNNLVNELFIDGQKLISSGGFANIQGRNPPGTKLLPPLPYEIFRFGASNSTSKSIKAQFDSMQIGDGIVLSDSQIFAIANHTDRNMTIETASQQ